MQQKTPSQSPATPDIEARFAQLVKMMEPEMWIRSNSFSVAQHPAYQEIIAMGESAIPLIFRQMEDCAAHWFPALSAITGADPVPEEMRGNVEFIKDIWQQWGRENGHLQ